MYHVYMEILDITDDEIGITHPGYKAHQDAKFQIFVREKFERQRYDDLNYWRLDADAKAKSSRNPCDSAVFQEVLEVRVIGYVLNI